MIEFIASFVIGGIIGGIIGIVAMCIFITVKDLNEEV